MRSNFQQIVLYCLDLYTQKLGLREVDLEPSPKRGDDKIKIQKQWRNTQKKASHMVQPELTYGSQHLQWETWKPVMREEWIGAEPQQIFTCRLEGWILNSIPTESQTNQARETLVDHLELEKNSDQIPKFYALQHIKKIFSKTTRTTNVHDWGYKSDRHTLRKHQVEPLGREKVRVLSKSAVSF